MLNSTEIQNSNNEIQRILDWCIAGKRSYQQQLYKKYSPVLLAVAIRYLKNKSDAENILKQAFMEIFQNLNKLKNTDEIFPWMKKIIINKSIKKLGKINFEDEIIISNDLVNIENIKKVWQAELLEAIKSLPDGARIIFNLHVIERYTHQEIAQLLSISTDISKSQCDIARKKLFELLKNK